MNSHPSPLSAKFTDSFAYPTIKDRIPVILTKVIDSLHRMKDEVEEKYGSDAKAEIKDIVGRVCKLRNEVQTNKPIVPITDDLPDSKIWNDYLELWQETNGGSPSWFNDPWLYVECYVYRRVHEAFQLSEILKDKVYPFQQDKENSFNGSQQAIITLMTFLMKTEEKKESSVELEKLFFEFLKVSLWGNKCDLSISALSENIQNIDPLTQIEHLQPNILVDDSRKIWDILKQINDQKSGDVRLDIVLDNSGFELIGDLCLAEFLTSKGLVSEVYFHGKSFPWFVSDVTKTDLMWTMNALCSSSNSALSNLGKKWMTRLKDGSWNYVDHIFWTTPYDYSRMKSVFPDLYSELSKSDLIIFKGDLNYRKLTGDLQWPHTTLYDVALRGFHPAPLCALRTLKADVVVGLNEGQDESVEMKHSDWMVSGNYAVIQYSGLRK